MSIEIVRSDLPIFWLAPKICIILSAARTGTVLFSTTILLLRATLAIIRAALSTYFKSAALPRPFPNVFVGVFTEMKINSASSMAVSMSFEKNRFRFRHFFTTSSKPGWNKTQTHTKKTEGKNLIRFLIWLFVWTIIRSRNEFNYSKKNYAILLILNPMHLRFKCFCWNFQLNQSQRFNNVCSLSSNQYSTKEIVVHCFLVRLKSVSFM